MFFQGQMFLVGRLAQLLLRHTVSTGLAHRFEFSCSSSKRWGPVLASFAERSRSRDGRVRRDGGGSHRLAGPSREQLLAHSCFANAYGDPCTQQQCPGG